MFGTMEPEIMFRAEKIERLGPKQYQITNGAVTTCLQPDPRWDLRGSSGTIKLGEHVSLRNVLFRVKRVPVLYIPYMYYPLTESDRKTGVLLPMYSYSKVRGHGVSNAFFWAINRSQDATIYHDAYQLSGQGLAAEYRYKAGPGAQGELRVQGFDEKERLKLDGTIDRPAHRTYEVRGTINQGLGGTFRLIGNVNYFTDVLTQQLYQQNPLDFSRRQRSILFSTSGSVRVRQASFRLEGIYRQDDVFTTLTAASRLGRTPQFNVTMTDIPIGRGTPVYVGGSAEVVHLEARPDLSSPALDRTLWRFDGTSGASYSPRIGDYLSFRMSAGWRLTQWLESVDPVTSLPVPVPITRSLFSFQGDMRGPVFVRAFQTNNRYADRLMHSIEPRVTVQWLSPFHDSARVIQIDPWVDGAVGGTSRVEYSLTNRVMARKKTGASTRSHDVFSVGIGQSYYSNALAAKTDSQYLTQTPGNFLPVWINASVTPTRDVTGSLRIDIHPKAKAVQSYSASARVHHERFDMTAIWTKRQFLPGVPFFDNPAFASHFLGATAGFNTSRVGASYGFNWDIRNNALVQQRAVIYMTAQCCGFSFDYQRIGIAHVGLSNVPVDQRFGFSVTLAGIGSFSNPFGAFKQ
jgi:hypothetical protein